MLWLAASPPRTSSERRWTALALEEVEVRKERDRTYHKCGPFPLAPDQTYKHKGWISWGDWLGTGNMKLGSKPWRRFDSAREHVLTLKSRSPEEWRQYSKSAAFPDDIPVAPHIVYKRKGWNGWTNWLGSREE